MRKDTVGRVSYRYASPRDTPEMRGGEMMIIIINFWVRNRIELRCRITVITYSKDQQFKKKNFLLVKKKKKRKERNLVYNLHK